MQLFGSSSARRWRCGEFPSSRLLDFPPRFAATLLCDEKPHHDSPVIAARFDGADASGLARELKSRNVLVSARHGNLRVSTHFYNNEEDLERLGQGLRALL